jgi:hypothetical protein
MAKYVPEWLSLDTECFVCGNRYSRTQWPYDYQGLSICAHCSGRLKPVVHYMRLGLLLAEKPCATETYGPADQCKCAPCTARRVVGWHQRFKTHRN